MNQIRRILWRVLAVVGLVSMFAPNAAQAASFPPWYRDYTSLTSRALHLIHQKKYVAATPATKKAIKLWIDHFGRGNTVAVILYFRLGTLYDQQDKYRTALTELHRALAAYDMARHAAKMYRPRSRTILTQIEMEIAYAHARLGHRYSESSRYQDAVKEYRRALDIDEKMHSQKNVTAVSLVVAGLYVKEGNLSAAEPLYKELIDIYGHQSTRADQLNTAKVLLFLGSLHSKEARFDSADVLFTRALAIYKKLQGPNGQSVATALDYLGGSYVRQGLYRKAEPILKRALTITENTSGQNSVDTAIMLAEIGKTYAWEERFTQSESTLQKALALLEKLLPPTNPNVADVMSELGADYLRQGRYDDAEPLVKRSLAAYEKIYPAGSVYATLAPLQLAELYRRSGQLNKAAPLYRKLIRVKLGTLKHYSALDDAAVFEFERKNYDDAKSLFTAALVGFQKKTGAHSRFVATALYNLGKVSLAQKNYSVAEQDIKAALTIRTQKLGPTDPITREARNKLAEIYQQQSKYSEAISLIGASLDEGTVPAWPGLPILFGGAAHHVIGANRAFNDSLKVFQHATQTAAAKALNALSVRFSAGTDRLATLVRRDQDIDNRIAGLHKAYLSVLSQVPTADNLAVRKRLNDQIATLAKAQANLRRTLRSEFPKYAALSRPQALTLSEIQALLADDEAMVVIDLGPKSYVWAITKTSNDWRELGVTGSQVAKTVATLRSELDVLSPEHFDTKLSFKLYRQILGPIAHDLRSKTRLSFVMNGALTSLPPQVLVTADPTGRTLKDVPWLIRNHAVTILPSIQSLKVLRQKRIIPSAKQPLIGFADPVFDRGLAGVEERQRVASTVAVSRGLTRSVPDLTILRKALPRLPGTATELKKVAASVKAPESDVILGLNATETRVKEAHLDQYRIVYFATHALLAGQVAKYAKFQEEPALVLTLPRKPTELDDGLLTASEIAQLKLNADWVVLSACDTAAGNKPGAAALSGLARAFFYAGGRSLIVSNWDVESKSAVALMVGTFKAIAVDPMLSHAQALQRSMLAMINNKVHPNWSEPRFWAPFVVVGEPAKPQ